MNFIVIKYGIKFLLDYIIISKKIKVLVSIELFIYILLFT